MDLIADQFTQHARARGNKLTLQVMGVETAYWHYPTKRAAAPTLVMIHGYRGNHRGLEAIAGALNEINIIIPDLPGFGESQPLSVEHSIDNYSWWLGEFLGKLNLTSKPHLLGHSFGSIIVSHHAAHGAKIQSLLLENPVSAPALKGPNAPMTKLAQAFFKLAELLPEKQSEAILKSWPMVRGMSIIMTKSWRKTLRKWVHQQHDENFNDFANRRVAIEGYRASISHFVAEYAQDFSVPTLVMIGSKDDITSPRQQAQMSNKITMEHELIEFAGVGHLTHYEIPDLIAESIQQFIQKHDRG